MRVALLSNVNLDLVGKALKAPTETWIPPGYGEWVVHTYAQGGAGLRDFDPEQVVLVLDGTALLDGVADAAVDQELADTIAHVERLADSFPTSRVVVSTLDFPARAIRPASAGRPEEHWAFAWRTALEDLARRVPHVHVLDLARLVSDVGRTGFYSPKMWYLGGQPYAMSATKVLAAAIDETLLLPRRARKKVMVVDLDNTLWGGVVGEDGPEGLVIGPTGAGAAYRDVQRRLRELASTGVLLAAVSKNEPADALAAFEQNRQMVLRPDDFVAVAASWDAKPEAIRSLAERLNLGLASFVFLDDNPVEREAVRQALPEVTVLDFPRDVAALPQVVVDAAADHFWVEQAHGRGRGQGRPVPPGGGAGGGAGLGRRHGRLPARARRTHRHRRDGRGPAGAHRAAHPEDQPVQRAHPALLRGGPGPARGAARPPHLLGRGVGPVRRRRPGRRGDGRRRRRDRHHRQPADELPGHGAGHRGRPCSRRSRTGSPRRA